MNDGLNNRVGLLFALNATNPNLFYMVPITQVISDLGLDGGTTLTRVQPDGVQSDGADLEKKVRDVIARHHNLFKDKHIVSVGIESDRNNNVYIAVHLDPLGDVNEIERRMPSKLEGYPLVVEPPAEGSHMRVKSHLTLG